MFDIHDCQTLLARRDIGVGARDIDVAGVFEWHQHIGHGFGFSEIGYVQGFHSITVDHEGVTELNGDGARVV
jgi:hypothetical protein